MFSVKEKIHIASQIEKLLLALDHPEMPKSKPNFTLHVDGKEAWSWADIRPNWLVEDAILSDSNPWNEVAREEMETP